MEILSQTTNQQTITKVGTREVPIILKFYVLPIRTRTIEYLFDQQFYTFWWILPSRGKHISLLQSFQRCIRCNNNSKFLFGIILPISSTLSRRLKFLEYRRSIVLECMLISLQRGEREQKECKMKLKLCMHINNVCKCSNKTLACNKCSAVILWTKAMHLLKWLTIRKCY